MAFSGPKSYQLPHYPWPPGVPYPRVYPSTLPQHRGTMREKSGAKTQHGGGGCSGKERWHSQEGFSSKFYKAYALVPLPSAMVRFTIITLSVLLFSFLTLLTISPKCVTAQADHSVCSCLRRVSMRVMNEALKIAHLNHVLV